MVISLTYRLKQFKHVQETQQMTPPSVLASRECREARPNRAMSHRWQCPAKRVEDNVPTVQSVRLDLKKGFLDKIVAICALDARREVSALDLTPRRNAP